ncbi:hypothetical protein Tco_1475548 [Tanacetum coccineum]
MISSCVKRYSLYIILKRRLYDRLWLFQLSRFLRIHQMEAWGQHAITQTPIIAPQLPPSLYYTPVSPDYSPASDSESDPSEDPSSDHIPPLPAISPFLSSDDDTTDNYRFYPEITYHTSSSGLRLYHPGTAYSHGPTYRYHPNGPIHMMTARKRVGLFLVQQLAVGHLVDHSSSDYFSPDVLARDSSSDSSSEASSDFHSDASSDSSSGHSLFRPFISDLSTLSPVRADLIPSPKRVKDFGYLTDVEVDPREISLRDDVIVRVSDEPYLTEERWIDARVVVELLIKMRQRLCERPVMRSEVERVTQPTMPEDIPEPAQEGAVEAIEEVQREQGHRIIEVESAVTALTERVAEKMPNTRSGVSMTHEEVEELVTRRVVEEMEAREAVRTLEPLNENGDEQEGENGGNGNGGNRESGNGNRNGNHGMDYGGVVGLTRWFEKMEIVFNISNCPPKYQVKYATCTLQDSALTWWNSHKRTISVEGAYAMNWVELMKLMTEVYCPRNENPEDGAGNCGIKTVKGNTDLLTLKASKELILFVYSNGPPDEEDKLQDAIRIANQLMDKKLQGYAARSAERIRGETVRRLDIRLGIVGLLLLQTLEAPFGNHRVLFGYEWEDQYIHGDGPKLRSQNRGNQTRNKNGNQTGGNEATTKAYAIGGGGTNPDSNVVTSYPFDIDLMPVELGSFDVIIDPKVIEKGMSRLSAQSYVLRKLRIKSEEKRLEDVPIIQEFPKVFLEDLPGLPPA